MTKRSFNHNLKRYLSSILDALAMPRKADGPRVYSETGSGRSTDISSMIFAISQATMATEPETQNNHYIDDGKQLQQSSS